MLFGLAALELVDARRISLPSMLPLTGWESFCSKIIPARLPAKAGLHGRILQSNNIHLDSRRADFREK